MWFISLINRKKFCSKNFFLGSDEKSSDIIIHQIKLKTYLPYLSPQILDLEWLNLKEIKLATIVPLLCIVLGKEKKRGVEVQMYSEKVVENMQICKERA